MWRTVVATALLSTPLALGQDMRENCVSCADTKRRCEIDCMLPTYRKDQELAWPYNHPENFADMSVCLAGCSSSFESCEETTEQTACLTCVSTCAVKYEASMLDCLQAVTDLSSKATVDDTSDDCSTNASFTMNVCSESCYSTDVYHGWSPSTEEGSTPGVQSSLDALVPDYRRAMSEHITSPAALNKQPEPLAQARTAQLAAAAQIETAENSLGNLGLAGVIGVSGLVATVILSVGLLTVTRLGSVSK